MTNLSGLTMLECAAGCSEKGCCITGGICGHPAKGGLQDRDKKPETLGRFAEACELLGITNKFEVAL